ncbi:MAG: M56 family metallopeptidase [Leptolyngbyaceae cyanobacterium CSU_1_4]|nr:M56 family metallopeptidase [Leptolyngbyaceae cyanobacterium CSU_1_4]
MHLSFIAFSIAAVFCIRLGISLEAEPRSWSSRWQRALSFFLLPPLLLMTTALAVLLMGTDGYMLGLPVGWIGYLWAIGFLGYAGLRLLGLMVGGWRSLQTVQTYDPFIFQKTANFQKTAGYILDTPALFAAQVGFWNSKLVISRGLLTSCNDAQIEAVLTHEAAHHHYRDTFWFFWMGWLRQATSWLPYSNVLWQELLLLRELRADQWAAQKIDALLLAETLLLVAKDCSSMPPEINCAAFSSAAPASRLEQRIEALLTEAEPFYQGQSIVFIWVFIAVLPLLTLLLHQ